MIALRLLLLLVLLSPVAAIAARPAATPPRFFEIVDYAPVPSPAPPKFRTWGDLIHYLRWLAAYRRSGL